MGSVEGLVQILSRVVEVAVASKDEEVTHGTEVIASGIEIREGPQQLTGLETRSVRMAGEESANHHRLIDQLSA